MSNNKPWYQQLVIVVGYVCIGGLVLGNVLNSFNNAAAIATLRLSVYGTLGLLVGWFVLQLFLWKWPLEWQQGQQRLRIRKLGVKPTLMVAGAIILLWLPHLIVISKHDSQALNKNESLESERKVVPPLTEEDAAQPAGVGSTVLCSDPPTRAFLNYWPISYRNPAPACHDFPALSARVLPDGKYPTSQQELEKPIVVHSGQAIRVRVYINNGAAENLDPSDGIARKVRLTTRVDLLFGPMHYVKIRFEGQNTNSQERMLTVMTAATEKLLVVAKSGQMRNWQNSEALLRNNLDVGNSILDLGDLLPYWQASIFIYYDLRVT